MKRSYRTGAFANEDALTPMWLPPAEPRGPQPLHDALTGVPLSCSYCGRAFYERSEVGQAAGLLFCKEGCQATKEEE